MLWIQVMTVCSYLYGLPPLGFRQTKQLISLVVV